MPKYVKSRPEMDYYEFRQRHEDYRNRVNRPVQVYSRPQPPAPDPAEEAYVEADEAPRRKTSAPSPKAKNEGFASSLKNMLLQYARPPMMEEDEADYEDEYEDEYEDRYEDEANATDAYEENDENEAPVEPDEVIADAPSPSEPEMDALDANSASVDEEVVDVPEDPMRTSAIEPVAPPIRPIPETEAEWDATETTNVEADDDYDDEALYDDDEETYDPFASLKALTHKAIDAAQRLRTRLTAPKGESQEDYDEDESFDAEREEPSMDADTDVDGEEIDVEGEADDLLPEAEKVSFSARLSGLFRRQPSRPEETFDDWYDPDDPDEAAIIDQATDDSYQGPFETVLPDGPNAPVSDDDEEMGVDIPSEPQSNAFAWPEDEESVEELEDSWDDDAPPQRKNQVAQLFSRLFYKLRHKKAQESEPLEAWEDDPSEEAFSDYNARYDASREEPYMNHPSNDSSVNEELYQLLGERTLSRKERRMLAEKAVREAEARRTPDEPVAPPVPAPAPAPFVEDQPTQIFTPIRQQKATESVPPTEAVVDSSVPAPSEPTPIENPAEPASSILPKEKPAGSESPILSPESVTAEWPVDRLAVKPEDKMAFHNDPVSAPRSSRPSVPVAQESYDNDEYDEEEERPASPRKLSLFGRSPAPAKDDEDEDDEDEEMVRAARKRSIFSRSYDEDEEEDEAEERPASPRKRSLFKRAADEEAADEEDDDEDEEDEMAAPRQKKSVVGRLFRRKDEAEDEAEDDEYDDEDEDDSYDDEDDEETDAPRRRKWSLFHRHDDEEDDEEDDEDEDEDYEEEEPVSRRQRKSAYADDEDDYEEALSPSRIRRPKVAQRPTDIDDDFEDEDDVEDEDDAEEDGDGFGQSVLTLLRFLLALLLICLLTVFTLRVLEERNVVSNDWARSTFGSIGKALFPLPTDIDMP